MMRWSRWPIAGLCLLLAVQGVGCAAGSAQRSTRLTDSDLDVTVNEVAARLAGSDFLADRSPQSPPIRIVTRKVENLSSDWISPAEQWMLIARVQSSLPIQELARRKNIVFQIPPEEIERLRQRGFMTPIDPEHQPTHIMTAVIRSATRAGRHAGEGYVDIRKEYYLLQYDITDLLSREKQWSDSFELAREARGIAWD